MNCKLSWNYPGACSDEKNEECFSRKSCKWQVSKNSKESVLDQKSSKQILEGK